MKGYVDLSGLWNVFHLFPGLLSLTLALTTGYDMTALRAIATMRFTRLVQ